MRFTQLLNSTRQSTRLLIIFALICTAAGAMLSGELLSKHLGTSKPDSMLGSLCEAGEDGVLSCDTVINSRWGMWPFEKEGDPPDTVRIPTALLGLAYYTWLFVWFAAVGRPTHDRRWWHLLPLASVVVGACGSVYFIYIMKTEFETFCQLCLYSHLANFGLLAATILLWPLQAASESGKSTKHGKGGKSPVEHVSAISTASTASHPTYRVAVISILLAFALIIFERRTEQLSKSERNSRNLLAAMADVQKNQDTMFDIYKNQERHKDLVRDDDPSRYGDKTLPTIVIFGDYQCPSCKKFEEKFTSTYLPYFDGFLRVVFKHYPLSNKCNEHVRKIGHVFACDASKLAEAVRMQGGNEKFWEVHDLLFERQDKLKDLDVQEVAKELGLDADRLVADINSDAVRIRIAEDIALGKKIGVKGTPAVFLSGRYVPPLVRGSELFWERIGELYKKERAKREKQKNSPSGHGHGHSHGGREKHPG